MFSIVGAAVSVPSLCRVMEGLPVVSTTVQLNFYILWTSPLYLFTVVPCILMLSKSFIYQLMHNRFALKEY
jgi:hypothetical protein